MDALNRIKVVLVEQKKTGKWLSEQLGVNVATTSRWCSNVTQPDLQTLDKIAKLLDVDVKDLLNSTENKIQNTMAKKAKVVKEKSIEDRIWDSANKLRGNLTASEYQNVVLGLVFLKYISDCFEKRYNELVEEGDGFEEDRDEYTAEHVFWVPQDARWQVIASKAHSPEIGQVIDHALEEIGKENPRLKKVMPNNYSRPEIDKIRLGEVVEIFDNMDMHAQGEGLDLFGRVYEYCLQNFVTETQQSGGEFYTPSCIVRTIVEVLQPFEGRVYDPACGSGGMFVQSAKFVQQHQGNLRNVTIYGQEFNANTWKMAHMNLAIRGLEADLGDSWGDSFGDDKHATKKFDFIMIQRTGARPH